MNSRQEEEKRKARLAEEAAMGIWDQHSRISANYRPDEAQVWEVSTRVTHPREKPMQKIQAM